MPELNRSPARNHFVPCVLRTIEILDALRHARSGLSIEEMRSSQRTSRSTTYRIIRSLLHGGYIARDAWGRYHLNPEIVQFAQDDSALRPGASKVDPVSSQSAADGFERWGVRFSSDGRRSDSIGGLTA